ncbi:MAG: NAD(P)-binding domain-containing protein [Actinomycetota bacterium]
MTALEKPFPPGRYQVVVVGSGPGGLQTSYSLGRLGIKHAVISADDAPGGMFRKFPLFQRLISWTKPFAPAEHGSRAYEWYDWNSLLADEPGSRGTVAEFMDGTSYFPSRSEMQRGLCAFAERGNLQIRHGCRWESTQKSEDGFVLGTTDGEYRCRVLVFAVGTTQAWKPAVPGIELVPHYVDAKPQAAYRNRDVFIIGKRNSGFEVADALLPVARRIVLASPRPAKVSVIERSLAGARARYLQPYEDHVLGGGNLLVDASIDQIERGENGFRIHTSGTTLAGSMVFDADEVVATTGFCTPLQDLSKLGVALFNQGRLPALTHYWESASVPGIYFAGSTTQASAGLRKYGLTGNSAAVHGFRYNARLMADRIAANHFGVEGAGSQVEPSRVIPYLLTEATTAPELWNQQSYLARQISFGEGTITDNGIVPLAHFVDSSGPDSVSITVESDDHGDIHPAVYLRRAGKIQEHLMASHPLNDFETSDHRRQLESLLKPYL